MKKKNLTDEEIERKNKIEAEKRALENSILIETEALLPKEAYKRNEQKEREIIELTGGGQTSIFSRKQFNKLLLRSPADRDITFIPEIYDEFFRLSGLKRDKKHPQYKPDIFAHYTIKYIYRRFQIKNLMDELRSRNPFITAESMREFKHYQFLNEENYNKLIQYISEAVTFMRSCNSMHEFDIKYCRKHGLATDGDMFYKPE